jgi:hypothetical protein
VAASTTVHAGYKCSFTHYLFRGVTAAIAPNRSLCVSAESVVEKVSRLENELQLESAVDKDN